MQLINIDKNKFKDRYQKEKKVVALGMMPLPKQNMLFETKEKKNVAEGKNLYCKCRHRILFS